MIWLLLIMTLCWSAAAALSFEDGTLTAGHIGAVLGWMTATGIEAHRLDDEADRRRAK